MNNNIQAKNATVIGKTNENKETSPKLPEPVFVKNRQSTEKLKTNTMLRKLKKLMNI